jgi:thioredoxin 1
MSIRHITTSDELDALIADHACVVIKYGATWCGPCKRIEPTFEAIAKEYEGRAEFVMANYDEAKSLFREQGVKIMPHFHFWVEGELIERLQSSDAVEVRSMSANVITSPVQSPAPSATPSATPSPSKKPRVGEVGIVNLPPPELLAEIIASAN